MIFCFPSSETHNNDNNNNDDISVQHFVEMRVRVNRQYWFAQTTRSNEVKHNKLFLVRIL